MRFEVKSLHYKFGTWKRFLGGAGSRKIRIATNSAFVLELATPAYLCGANQHDNPSNFDLRPATRRAQLRWLWRTMNVSHLDPATFRKLETDICGDSNAAGAVRIVAKKFATVSKRCEARLNRSTRITSSCRNRDVLCQIPTRPQHQVNRLIQFRIGIPQCCIRQRQRLASQQIRLRHIAQCSCQTSSCLIQGGSYGNRSWKIQYLTQAYTLFPLVTDL